ncbi:MAG: nuclease domain-containing protein [Rhodoferax sp.]|uniref:nuclease domain-containing protein n=1 Tax=Rhodoferax sp. TaxID=50421 RepID=UPI002ACD3353|nr:nuclease domain-containing protein [Rhodoferax sp.]MDZ7892343.1 nuclease domain-containing protein [Rhodoferax sp.]
MTSIAGSRPTPCPKVEVNRNPTLLTMARGRHCLLRVPGVCQGGTETTVAAHSNWACHGKAGARKADDQYSVWGCFGCHSWLDQGRAAKDVKQMAFRLAHIDQVLEWRRIAQDPTEKPRDRKAALWALEKLNASPALIK